jgi:hypothetical protein
MLIFSCVDVDHSRDTTESGTDRLFFVAAPLTPERPFLGLRRLVARPHSMTPSPAARVAVSSPSPGGDRRIPHAPNLVAAVRTLRRISIGRRTTSTGER